MSGCEATTGAHVRAAGEDYCENCGMTMEPVIKAPSMGHYYGGQLMVDDLAPELRSVLVPVTFTGTAAGTGEPITYKVSRTRDTFRAGILSGYACQDSCRTVSPNVTNHGQLAIGDGLTMAPLGVVLNWLAAGSASKADRDRLRAALDKADAAVSAPPQERATADAALGRAIGAAGKWNGLQGFLRGLP